MVANVIIMLSKHHIIQQDSNGAQVYDGQQIQIMLSDLALSL